MSLLCGLGALCGNVVPAAEELTKQEVADLFSSSTRLNGGRLIVHGLFARTDTRNTNGRIYPKSIMKREVTRFRRQHVKHGTALGELNHPSYYSSYFRSLNLPNVSHQVLDVWWRGRELWGVIEVLPTPAGLLLWELYSKGIKLGVSSRGWASVVVDPSTQQMFVDKDFQLITFDFVTEPSNAGAFLVPVSWKYRRRLPDQSRVVRVSYLGIGSSHMTQLAQIPGATLLSNWLKQTSKAMSLAQHLVTATPQRQRSQSSVTLGSPNAAGSTLLQPPSAAVAVACSANPNGEDTSLAAASPPQGLRRTASGCSDAAAGSFLAALGSRSPSGTATLPPYTSLGGGVILGCHYQVLAEPWLPVDPAGREFKMHLSLVATKAHLLQQKQEQKSQQTVKRRQQRLRPAENIQPCEFTQVLGEEQQSLQAATGAQDAAGPAGGATVAIQIQKRQPGRKLDQCKPQVASNMVAVQQQQQADLSLPSHQPQEAVAEDNRQAQQQQQDQQPEPQHISLGGAPASSEPKLPPGLTASSFTRGTALQPSSEENITCGLQQPSLTPQQQMQQQQHVECGLQDQQMLHQQGSTSHQTSLQDQARQLQIFRHRLSVRTRVAPQATAHIIALSDTSTGQQLLLQEDEIVRNERDGADVHKLDVTRDLSSQCSPDICSAQQQHKYSHSNSGIECSSSSSNNTVWYAENAYPGLVTTSHHHQHTVADAANTAASDCQSLVDSSGLIAGQP